MRGLQASKLIICSEEGVIGAGEFINYVGSVDVLFVVAILKTTCRTSVPICD